MLPDREDRGTDRRQVGTKDGRSVQQKASWVGKTHKVKFTKGRLGWQNARGTVHKRQAGLTDGKGARPLSGGLAKGILGWQKPSWGLTDSWWGWQKPGWFGRKEVGLAKAGLVWQEAGGVGKRQNVGSHSSSYLFLKARDFAMEMDSSTSIAQTRIANPIFRPKLSIGNHQLIVSCGRPCKSRTLCQLIVLTLSDRPKQHLTDNNGRVTTTVATTTRTTTMILIILISAMMIILVIIIYHSY